MRGEDRGQTTIDFAVGIGFFLIAVAFVLAFVPSMFAPFFGMGASDALVTDRSAAYLSENALVEDPSQPGALDPDEVNGFFDDCNGSTLAQQLGVDTEQINVSIGDRTGIPATLDGTPLTCGPPPDGSDTVSNRIITIGDDQWTLRVVAW